MIKRIIYILSIAFFVVHPSIFGQSYDHCLKKIRKYNKKLGNIDFPKGDKVYHFSYQNIIEHATKGYTEYVNNDVNIYMSKDQLHYLTNDIEVYQDFRDAFMIIHSKKIVMWTISAINREKEKRLKDLIQLRDTLFHYCEVKNCENQKYSDGRNIQKTTLKLHPDAQRTFKMNTISYWYDLDKEVVTKVVTDFIPGYEAKKMTVIYKNINLDSDKKLHKPVAGLILNKKLKLLSKYKGYHLIDNR